MKMLFPLKPEQKLCEEFDSGLEKVLSGSPG